MAQKISTLSGILWHQGEHDACEELIGPYREKLLNFFGDLRADLQTTVPILIGGVPLEEYSPDPEKRRYAAMVNDTLRAVAAALPNAYFVSSKGLTSNPDHLHINSPSLRVFGERYYKVFSEQKSLFD